MSRLPDEGIPRWVDAEIENWARSQWLGPWPGPRRVLAEGPAFCEFTPYQDHTDTDEPADVPVNEERAARVHAVYESLPLIERRIVQAEYTRRHEYGGRTTRERQGRACKVLGVPLAYYLLALDNFRHLVWRAFS